MTEWREGDRSIGFDSSHQFATIPLSGSSMQSWGIFQNATDYETIYHKDLCED
jgi:hypothetical protein